MSVNLRIKASYLALLVNGANAPVKSGVVISQDCSKIFVMDGVITPVDCGLSSMLTVSDSTAKRAIEIVREHLAPVGTGIQ